MARTESAPAKRRRAGCILVLATLAAMCVPIAAAAQEEKKSAGDSAAPAFHPLPKGGPAPRTPDGHPDLSGVWFPGTSGGYDTSNSTALRTFDPKVTPEEKPPYQPWAAAKIKSMTAVDFELGRASVNCMPRGTPGMFLMNPYPTNEFNSLCRLSQCRITQDPSKPCDMVGIPIDPNHCDFAGPGPGADYQMV